MARKIKGIVLAAGFGTRLRPLTDHFPKPLVPFAGVTPLALALFRLAQAGVREVAVNTHYLAAPIVAYLNTRPFGLEIHVAHEPEILGTGGVYNPLRAWAGDATLVVINGDVVSTIDVSALLACHQQNDAVATMALLPAVLPGQSAVYVEGGRVTAIGREPPSPQASATNFACIQILSNPFIDLLPREGSFDIISSGYHVALARHLTVAGQLHHGYWHDMGQPAAYWRALRELLAGDDMLWKSLGLGRDHFYPAGETPRGCGIVVGPALVHPGTQLGVGARIGPHGVVESDSLVAAGATVTNALLLPGSQVAAGEVVKDAIFGKNLRMPLPAV